MSLVITFPLASMSSVLEHGVEDRLHVQDLRLACLSAGRDEPVHSLPVCSRREQLARPRRSRRRGAPRPGRRRLVSRQRQRPPASPRFGGRRHGRCARGRSMGPSGRASRWRAVRRRPRRDRSAGCRALVRDRRSATNAPCRRRRRECRGRPRAGRRRLRSEPKRRSRPHSSSHPPPRAIPSSRPIVTRRPVRRRVNVAAAMFGSVAGTYGGARSRSMCTSPCIRKKSGSALRNTTTRTDSSASSRPNVSRSATKNGPSTRFVGGWSIVTVATASSISTCNAIDRCFPSARTSPRFGDASLNECTRLFAARFPPTD